MTTTTTDDTTTAATRTTHIATRLQFLGCDMDVTVQQPQGTPPMLTVHHGLSGFIVSGTPAELAEFARRITAAVEALQ